MRLPLVPSDAPVLRTKAKRIGDPASVRDLAEDMFQTLEAEIGVGLAAPQLGKSIRLFVTHTEEGRFVFINPTLVWTSDETVAWEEGCLSLPRLYGEVVRPVRVTMKATDLAGKTRIYAADKLFARVLQHELDHLDGILFPDQMTDLSKLRRISQEEWDNRGSSQEEHAGEFG